jgi:DNA-binding MarR family transcriptional regulator
MPTPKTNALPSDDAALRLDNQLCFLLYAGGRAMTQLYQPLLAPLGVTYPQYLVLLLLWEEAPAPLSVGRLCTRLQLDSGTLTPLIKRMESAGLVQRERARRDGRVVDVALTPAGQALKEAARAVPEALVCRLGLSLSELARIRRGLQKILDVTTRGGEAE